MKDVLFKTEEYVFSYRVAGICVRDGHVLLQKVPNESGYAFPGGHVSLGESNAETLVREFKEEIGADVRVGALRWVGELFFPWGERRCHQICLYYAVEITDEHTPTYGIFLGKDLLDQKDFSLEFHWIPIQALKSIEVYPTQAAELILNPNVQHFIYCE